MRSGQESWSKPQHGVPMLWEGENTVPGHSTRGQAEPNLCSIPAASLHGSQPVPDPCQHSSIT